jgi:hypothetical protein
LPRAERAKLHAAAGRWLAERATGQEDVLAELVAYHFREAVTLFEAIGEGAAPDLSGQAELWLGKAADAATAAGATLEAAQHLRAALPVTPPERLPELWLRIAESAPDGGLSIGALETALETGAAQGRSGAWRLEVIGRLLMWHTRFNGSVPERLRLDLQQINEIRAEGESLMEVTDDERGRAQYLIAESFLPFWYSSSSIPLHDSGHVLAEKRAAEGLALAEHLDDATMISAALDGIGSNAQERGAWATVRDTNRRRLEMADRLVLTEVVDAQAMVAMASVVLGDFGEAERDSADALAALRPGQVPMWALHLCSWRTYGLTLAGRWDEALSSAERAHQLWTEIGRGPAAFALLGFVAAMQISRCRRDARRTQVFEQTWDEISDRFGLSPRSRFGEDIRSGKFQSMLPTIDFTGNNAAVLERWLYEANDRGVRVPRETVEPVLSEAKAMNAGALSVEVLRAIGLAEADANRLREALAIAERIGAKPAIGRLRCEIGLLSGDASLVEGGRQVLREIGDLTSLDRYEGDRL